MIAQSSNAARVRPIVMTPEAATATSFRERVRPAIAKLWTCLPGGVLAALGFGTDTLTVASARDAVDAGPSSQLLRSLGVLWPAQVDRICAEQSQARFLIEGLLPTKSLGIVAGESTIGKSALIYQLGLCVAAGVPFLGMATDQGRVLYFDLENSLHDCKTMRDSLLRHLGNQETPRDFLLKPEPPEHLERLLDAVEPQLVVIDSLRSFRPDVTDKNRTAGEWLKEIRRISHKCGCTFLIVHHVKKPNKEAPAPGNLESCSAASWLLAMEGPRAFVNQTDVRIAVAEGDLRSQNPPALQLKWSVRVRGDSPVVSLERVFDEDGEPAGYRHLAGAALLDEEKRAVLGRLPGEFSTADVKAARRDQHLGDGNDPTNKFLAECKQLRIIARLARGHWRKVAS